MRNGLDYRIEKKEAFEVVLRKKRFPNQYEITTREITKFWKECGSDGTIDAICKYIHPNNIFDKCIVGVSFGAETASTDEDFPYGIGAHYNGEKISEDYLTVEKIPAHTYAVFKCTGTMPKNEIPPATQVDICCIKCDETVPNIFRHFQTYQQVFCLQHIGL